MNHFNILLISQNQNKENNLVPLMYMLYSNFNYFSCLIGWLSNYSGSIIKSIASQFLSPLVF